jgi:hypothetical protein
VSTLSVRSAVKAQLHAWGLYRHRPPMSGWGEDEQQSWKRTRRIGFILWTLFTTVVCGLLGGSLIVFIPAVVNWCMGQPSPTPGEDWVWWTAGAMGLLFPITTAQWVVTEANYRRFEEELICGMRFNHYGRRPSRTALRRRAYSEPILLIPMAQRVEATEQRVSDASRETC